MEGLFCINCRSHSDEKHCRRSRGRIVFETTTEVRPLKHLKWYAGWFASTILDSALNSHSFNGLQKEVNNHLSSFMLVLSAVKYG